MGATPGTVTSPWPWDAYDYTGTNGIHLTLTFDNTTRALSGGSVTRDAGCLYQTVYLDTPTLNKSFTVPAGTTNFSAKQIQHATGFTTIDQVLAVQITAGP